MQKKLKILFFFLILLFSGIYNYAQNGDSSFFEINNLISKDRDLSVYKLNIIYKQAIIQHDTPLILECFDFYIKIFGQDSVNYNEKNFLIKKIALLKAINLQHPKDSSNINKLLSTYEKLAEFYLKTYEKNTAIEIYYRMLFLAQNLENKSKEINTYNLLARVYQKELNYKKSNSFLSKALSESQNIGDSVLVYQSYMNLGDLNFQFGFFSEALTNYYAALYISEFLESHFFENRAYYNIAKIFYNLDYFEKSLEYLSKALSLKYNQNEKNISSEDIAKNYLFAGENYLQLSDPKKALVYFIKAQNSLKNSKNFYLIAEKNTFLGITYIELNNLQSAKKYLLKAIILQRKISDKDGLNKSNYALGKYNLQIKNNSTAKYYLIKSFKYSKEHHDYIILKESSYLLYQIFKKENNYSKSLEYLEENSIAYSFIAKQNMSISVERIEVEHNYKKNTAIANQKVETLNTEKQKLKLLLFILVVALVFIFLLAVFFFRKNAIIDRQKNLIEKQKQIILKQYDRFKLLSLVASHTDNSIFIMDTKGKILWINDSLLKLYNRSHYEIYTQNDGDFKKLAQYDFNKINQACNVEKKSITYVTDYFVQNQQIWVQTTITPIIENNEVTKLIGIESEITSLKKAQIEIQTQTKDIEFKNKLLEIYNLELKQQKESITAQNEELHQQQEELQSHMELLEEYNNKLHRLSVVASETDNVIYIFDITGKLIWVNEAFTKHTGYSFQEYKEQIGENIIAASSVPDIDYYFFSCIEQNKSVTYISEFSTKYKKKLWLQTTLSPIKNEEGEIVEIVAIDTDITETKNAEQKILQQNQEIKSSLEYAGLIQRSVMPLPIFIDAIFEKNFVFNRPRDIVSGDFFFVHYHNDVSILAIADCTGHGIPGAFMSLLGTMAMRIVVSRTKSYNPNILLNMLNGEIIKLLHQRGRKNETIDSIDMALCVFDLKNDILDYSGANIPLYLARKLEDKYSINRIKPTKATIGYDSLKEQFTVHSFKLNKGDRLYMSSDGLGDQFGGIQNKKLKRKGFVEMLEFINSIPFNQQNEALENFLDRWMGSIDQIDDMMFIGIEY